MQYSSKTCDRLAHAMFEAGMCTLLQLGRQYFSWQDVIITCEFTADS